MLKKCDSRQNECASWTAANHTFVKRGFFSRRESVLAPARDACQGAEHVLCLERPAERYINTDK